MGRIQEEVKSGHLTRYPTEIEFLKPFLPGFDVTWAKRRIAFNTELSVYFLRPDAVMAEMFGFAKELMLVYSPYATLQPRALQAAEQFIDDEPARGRIEKLTLLLISEADAPQEWVRTHNVSHQEPRVVVAFQADELRGAIADSWFVRNKISEQLFTRDLFDYRLPLESDTYFFGREELLLDYRDAAKRGENRGVFGLRKTGKTSFLFKLRRFLENENTQVLYYDCKSPSVRQLHWYELLEIIGRDIAALIGLKFYAPTDKRRYADRFTKLLSRNEITKKTLIIFDEVEYISPFAIDDKHWKEEYLPFWQTIWAGQSIHRRLSILIAGVNPRVVELDKINGVQNPLFGIVPHNFLRGLGPDEVRRMLRVLGQRIGLTFTDSACSYMFYRYGGHPLLTRLAASFIHRRALVEQRTRPLPVEDSVLQSTEDVREGELTFYCRHVVSELGEFYPDEYSMLEWISSGNVGEYLEFADHPEHVRHLKEYGLIAEQPGKGPRVSIAVIARYVALEDARRNGRKTILKVIDPVERIKWLHRRKDAIIEDLGELNHIATSNGLASLFGPNSFPESHRFAQVGVVDSEGTFESFINCCHRCFIESIDENGRHQRKSNYFWEDIKRDYPALQEALHRIRVYRHNRMHIYLNPTVEANVERFIKQDLEGRDPRNVEGLWFVLQQSTLDALWNALQIEIAIRSR
jgi:hypothetical protein